MKTALKLELHKARAIAEAARITGPQIAWNKASVGAGHERSTHLFNTPPNGPALPGNEAFGIGLSGGNGGQDIACGMAGLRAPAALLAPKGLDLLIEPDIKR